MRLTHVHRLLVVLLAAAVAGCANTGGDSANGNGNGNGHHHVVSIEPGDDAQEKMQEALINAEPGQVIELAAGTYKFNSTLSLEDVDGVTIRGAGIKDTILDFSEQQQGTGGEGIKITSNDFTIENLTVQDSASDGIKTEGCKGLTFRNVCAQWTGEPSPDNGAYGLYPVLSEEVIIDGCEAYGASDAGIYVGQSKNVIVSNCRAERNVAGIEIENTIGADVSNCVATNNAGGLLVFSLPGLKEKRGYQCRVFNNNVYENNHENFAKPGTTVAGVPPGTGLLIMANDQVEVFNNEFKNNQTANVSIISYKATMTKYDDPDYDPYPEAIYIHNNTFEGGGDSPGGSIGKLAGGLLGGTLPDIIYDGWIDPEKAVEGQLPAELQIYIGDNGDADFANLNLGEGVLAPKVSTELGPHQGAHDPLPEITTSGAQGSD